MLCEYLLIFQIFCQHYFKKSIVFQICHYYISVKLDIGTLIVRCYVNTQPFPQLGLTSFAVEKISQHYLKKVNAFSNFKKSLLDIEILMACSLWEVAWIPTHFPELSLTSNASEYFLNIFLEKNQFSFKLEKSACYHFFLILFFHSTNLIFWAPQHLIKNHFSPFNLWT